MKNIQLVFLILASIILTACPQIGFGTSPDIATETIVPISTTEAVPTSSAVILPNSPTVTPSPIRTQSVTVTPIVTRRPTAIATPPLTTTRMHLATTSPVGIPTIPAGSVTLLEPLESVLKGRHIFRWHTDIQLLEGQLFELVLWEVGQEPMIDSFGPVGASAETTVRVDLDRASDAIPQFSAGRDYQWGILLVKLNPYNRLRYLGGGHQFRFERSDGSGSSGGGYSPTATPRG